MTDKVRNRTSGWSSRSWLLALLEWAGGTFLAWRLGWDARGYAVVCGIASVTWWGIKAYMRGLDVAEVWMRAKLGASPKEAGS